jgi:two-component system, NarL family, response regulator NreC
VPVHLQVAPALAVSSPAPWVEPSIRVVLADGHALMRRRLRLLLGDEDNIEVVAEADDLSTAVRHVRGYLPHVLVIDLSMSNGSSIDAIRALRERLPSAQIVVVTMENNAVFAQEALDAGAIGFVLKQAADAELAQGVRSAARGREYVSPRVAARLASRRRSLAEDRLSRRETSVMD